MLRLARKRITSHHTTRAYVGCSCSSQLSDMYRRPLHSSARRITSHHTTRASVGMGECASPPPSPRGPDLCPLYNSLAYSPLFFLWPCNMLNTQEGGKYPTPHLTRTLTRTCARTRRCRRVWWVCSRLCAGWPGRRCRCADSCLRPSDRSSTTRHATTCWRPLQLCSRWFA